MAKLLLLQGPNLNLLGTRQTSIYGETTLAALHDHLWSLAQQYGHQLDCLQSNAEHELIQAIHQTKTAKIDFIIINPGAYAHTSIALRDALMGIAIPFIEIHISNIYARESFRQHSYLADIAVGNIIGFGVMGYELAFIAADHYLRQGKSFPLKK